MRRSISVLLLLALVFALAGCSSSSSAVSVQRADQLKAAGLAGDRYAGVVVSEHVAEIQRDSTKTIEELYVEVGQEVKTGDKLFSYDSAALELDLEKLQLEVEKMTGEQTTYAEQQAKLEKQLARTYNESQKVQLTLEINTLKATQMENDYNIAAKNQEIEKIQGMLQNIDILSPVDGTVRSINEQGESGSPYITIQQAGAYRIQGTVNELDMGGSLMEGTRVKAYSRVNDDTWTGTVDTIDTENVVQDNNNYYYVDSGSGMTTSSNYYFYVTLDDVTGLMLGQHVYMEVMAGEELTMPGLWLPENYLVDMATNEETFEMTAKVFADQGGKLAQVDVTLGMYDYMTGCYEILSGISAGDYLADPMAPGCEAGVATQRREASDFGYAAPVEPVASDETAVAEPLPGELALVVPEGDGVMIHEDFPEREPVLDEPASETEG